MDYEQLENDVVTRLNESLSTTHVIQNIPEAESEFDKEVRKTRIFVGYGGSDFGPSKSMSDVVQDEDGELILQVESRLLRGENNLYWTLDKCRKLLVNFRSASGNTLRFHLKSQKLVGVKDQVKQWHQTFRYTSVVVTDEEEEGGPPMDQIEFQTNSI